MGVANTSFIIGFSTCISIRIVVSDGFPAYMVYFRFVRMLCARGIPSGGMRGAAE